ncbi:aliphatic sulfonate ABC transporter substrate-binding protein [Erwiniaceae bacterium BAC15a-03b]|uniref:Putative aliphatic sulfonates-binding protein n=1 Tax=Winslowiella arboricola TaxID=2978220 RepID=A0A9J6PL48_9GAMM|nr:aliphatic sulfonate ABC transporter substrate-binding protein [Winslowiella arboricola]MCU5771369.1 aliphatic sulfonate ABC transporter substrate-binding protein [Winslowiella arboricola]MCU5777179.1 aliphatic sulfonate ABC transporter substrate-binding protein [Winslowiella arboricola]
MKKTLITLSLLLATLAGSSHAATTLSIGDQRGNARAILEAAGELNKLDYTIDWHEFANAAPLLEALGAGSLDGGSVGDAPLTFAVAAGLDAKAIFAVKYAGNAIIVKKGSAITSVQQLAGKRVATVKGSSGHNLALQALAQAGVDAKSVKFVFTTPAEATLVLDQGGVDAVATWEPYVSFATDQSAARIITDGKDFPALSYFVASNQAIQHKKAALADFTRRLERARLWGSQHPQPYAASISKLLRLPESVALLKVKRELSQPLNNQQQALQIQQATADRYLQAGLIPHAVEAKGFVDLNAVKGE